MSVKVTLESEGKLVIMLLLKNYFKNLTNKQKKWGELYGQWTTTKQKTLRSGHNVFDTLAALTVLIVTGLKRKIKAHFVALL